MVVRESVNTEPGSLNIKRPRELKFHPVIPCYFLPRDSGTTKRCSRIKRESSPCSSRERERETWNFRVLLPNRIESELPLDRFSWKGGLRDLDRRTVDTEEGVGGGGIGVITGRPDNWIQLRRN